MKDNNNKKIRERSGSQRWSWTMAPNLALLAITPDLTGLPAAAAGKSSRLHWFYDFIVTQQTRHTASEVAR
jgi:hypothetical protein